MSCLRRSICCCSLITFLQMNNSSKGTNEGIRQAGIDVRLSDIGVAIQEVIESHEVVCCCCSISMLPVVSLLNATNTL